MRTETGGNTARNDFECSANRVAFFLCPLDLFHHLIRNARQNATRDIVVTDRFELLPGNCEIVRNACIPYRGRVAENLNSELPEKNLREPAAGNPRRRLPRARSFEDVASVRVIEFE